MTPISQPSAPPVRLAVFASGGGTNFQALLDAFHASPDSRIRIVLLLASAASIGAVERAERAGVPVEVIAHADSEGILKALRTAHVDWIVLAGYLRLVPPAVLEDFPGRVLNIHPALLPSFGGRGMYGRRVHEAVLDSGVRISGATVHRVDREYDSGAIVAQWPVAVRDDDTPEALAARVLQVEHRLLPAVVERLTTGEGSADPKPHFTPSDAPPELSEIGAGASSASTGATRR